MKQKTTALLWLTAWCLALGEFLWGFVLFLFVPGMKFEGLALINLALAFIFCRCCFPQKIAAFLWFAACCFALGEFLWGFALFLFVPEMKFEGLALINLALAFIFCRHCFRKK